MNPGGGSRAPVVLFEDEHVTLRVTCASDDSRAQS